MRYLCARHLQNPAHIEFQGCEAERCKNSQPWTVIAEHHPHMFLTGSSAVDLALKWKDVVILQCSLCFCLGCCGLDLAVCTLQGLALVHPD